MKQGYTVHLQTAPLEETVDEEKILAIASMLDHDRTIAAPALSFESSVRTLGLTASVDVETSETEAPGRALSAVTKAFATALVRNGIVGAHLGDVALEIDRGDGTDRQALLSGAEVAEWLGVTRQRVQQLASMPGRFPHPVANFGLVSIWRRGDIADWIAAGNGTPSRLTADAAALGFTLSGRRNPKHRAEMLRRLIELANAGDEVSVEYLEANPELAFQDRGVWVEQVDSGRGAGLAAGMDPRGHPRVVRTRR